MAGKALSGSALTDRPQPLPTPSLERRRATAPDSERLVKGKNMARFSAWFSRLGVRTKILGSMAVVLVLLGIVGLIGWRNTTQFSDDVHSLYAGQLVPSIQL